jgi:hypothetical protein
MKLNNEYFHNSYSSPGITRIIKSRKITWAGHVAQLGEEEFVDIVGKARRKERTKETKK